MKCQNKHYITQTIEVQDRQHYDRPDDKHACAFVMILVVGYVPSVFGNKTEQLMRRTFPVHTETNTRALENRLASPHGHEAGEADRLSSALLGHTPLNVVNNSHILGDAGQEPSFYTRMFSLTKTTS